MLEIGQKVLFICPDRCHTWQLGVVAMKVEDAIIVEPTNDKIYVYDDHKVYRFKQNEVGKTIKPWTNELETSVLHRQQFN